MGQCEVGEATALWSGFGEGGRDGVDGKGIGVRKTVKAGSVVCRDEEVKDIVYSEHAKGNVFSWNLTCRAIYIRDDDKSKQR